MLISVVSFTHVLFSLYFCPDKGELDDYLLRLRSRLNTLPDEHYTLLKYIVGFLVAVASHKDVNKMGPMPLGIVFGPNIFR